MFTLQQKIVKRSQISNKIFFFFIQKDKWGWCVFLSILCPPVSDWQSDFLPISRKIIKSHCFFPSQFEIQQPKITSWKSFSWTKKEVPLILIRNGQTIETLPLAKFIDGHKWRIHDTKLKDFTIFEIIIKSILELHVKKLQY